MDKGWLLELGHDEQDTGGIMSEIPYMMEDTPEEFERVRRLLPRVPERAEWERYIKWLQDGRPELKTADEWSELKGFIIKDPDGWREEGATPWHYRISEEEFDLRAGSCTIQMRRNDVY